MDVRRRLLTRQTTATAAATVTVTERTLRARSAYRSGVAKESTLYAVRALGCDGYGSFSGLALAIDWITANHVKPAVISMSIGGGQSETVNAAIRGAIALGITVVGAAGNEGEDSCLHLMGGVPEALVVGASGYNDWRDGYSNIGSCLDVFAPGGGITSAYAGNDTGFTTMSGTSMATPHVSGAAALYLQQKPGAAPAEVVAAITGSATRGVIRDAGLSSPNRLLFTPHFGDGSRRPFHWLSRVPERSSMERSA